MKVSKTYSSPREWAKECRLNMERDDDNLVLFTGKPGAGKSTVMFQLLRAVDPSFDVRRVAFTIKDFLRLSRMAPKGVCIAADEALAAARKAMYRDNIDLVDRLQVCRGKNHTMGMCFPYARRLDEAIMEDRVRFRIDIPQKGAFYYVIWERQDTLTRGKKGAMVEGVSWVERGKFAFEMNAGALWKEYRDAKDAHMDAQGAEESEAVKPDADAASGEDWGAVADFLSSARVNANRAAAGSAVRPGP